MAAPTRKTRTPPELTHFDLTTIALALETHERVAIERTKNPDCPAAIAARKTLAKVRPMLNRTARIT